MTKINSITPKYDITWYVKWIASIIVLIGITIRASGVTQLQWLDIVCSWIGAVGWMYVGIRWNDKAIILVNFIMAIINAVGIATMMGII